MPRRLPAAEKHIASLWRRGGLSWKEFFRRTWAGIDDNDLVNRAYELAFNFLLAVFPFLLFLVACFDMFAGEGSAMRRNLFGYLTLALPPDASQLLIYTLHQVTHNSAGQLTFGLLFALYSGSAGMTQLISTLNAAYEVHETRSWIKVRVMSLGLTLAMSILVIVAMALILLGGNMVGRLGQSLGLPAVASIAIKLVEWALALCFLIFAFAAIYYFAPNVKRQHLHWITPGSLTGVVLWALASAGLRLYLHFFNRYSYTYGSLGAVIILMLWFYVAGLAMLIGGQINAIVETAAAEGENAAVEVSDRKAA